MSTKKDEKQKSHDHDKQKVQNLVIEHTLT